VDDGDRAAPIIEASRAEALHRQRERARETEEALEIDGVRVCLDCRQPLSDGRRQARPEAVRCIGCKRELESRINRGLA